MKGRGLRHVIAMVVLALGAGCASLPSDYPRPQPGFALAPDPGTSLGRHAEEYAARHGANGSGFAAIDANGEALRWRIALVDTAERSIDMLYYLWYRDLGGLVLLEHVIEAADRGVRVRIVVDDTLFIKGKAGLANIAAHPNIEIRIFNPWAHKGVGRLFETVARAKRLNHRMHNKLLIADNRMAILGGRNVGDHYFGLNHKYNFHDLDMVVLGDAATESSAIFDHFWNSDRVIPATAFVEDASWAPVDTVRGQEIDQLREARELQSFPVTGRRWDDELTALVDRMSLGTSTVEFDRVLSETPVPSRDGVAGLAEVVEHAQREVLILNAYIIPGERMLQILLEAHQRGVRVRMLTNSLASNDVPAVTSKYAKYRRTLLNAGVELYEFRSDPEIQRGTVDTNPVESNFAGFHTKAAVVDREIVYIGSLNLDPRSIRLNTEMGMIVHSRGLAEEVAAIAERDMDPANSWRVVLDNDGELSWESGAGTVTRQPAQGGWQRVQAWFFKILPEGQL